MESDEINIPLIFKDYHKLKRRYIGLRTKVAIKEAVGCIILSSILLFVHLGSIDLNILTLAPVIYVMISFNISSYIVIQNGLILVWSGLVSAIYIALLSMLLELGDFMIWVSFVLNFFFCFILYSFMPGKRWMNIFACKMVLINITVVVYFNYGFSRYALMSQLLIVLSLLSACAIFCGVFIFPWLATRMFSKKVIKTLDTVKILFQSIGNQIEGKNNENREDSNSTTYTFNESGGGVPLSEINGKKSQPKDLASIMVKFNKEIKRLNVLLAECRSERWNSVLTSHYESLLAQLLLFQKQIQSMKSSIENDFSIESRKNIILPMLPVVESLIQQISIQLTIFIEILLNEEYYDQEDIVHESDNEPLPFYSDLNGRPSVEYKVQVAKQSFKLTIELIDKAKDFYKTLNVNNQNYDTLNFDEESRKINYFFTEIFEFSLSQKNILKLILDIKRNTRKERVFMELIKYGLWSLILTFPLFIKKRFSRILLKGNFKNSKKWEFKEWFRNNFIINGRWQYPLQVAIGFVSTNIIFHFFDLKVYNQFVVHGLWTCITTIIVFQPSLGSTVTRSIHRIIGTLLGGFAGYLVAWSTQLVDLTIGKDLIILSCTFAWVFLCSHVQQDPMYTYAGSVSALTFILISFSQFLSSDFTFMYAVLRLFFVFLGIIAVLLISLLFFPLFTYKDTRTKIFKNISSITSTICKIIETNLPLTKTYRDTTSINISPDSNRPHSYGHSQRKGIKIGKSRGTMDASQKEITNSIKLIRQLNGVINGSLLDIKSEFFFKPAKYSKYLSIYHELTQLHSYLVSADTVLSYPFRDRVLDELQPSFAPIQELIEDIKNFSSQFLLLTKPDSDHNNIAINSPTDLLIHLRSLETEIKKIRESLLQRNELQNTYPDFVQYEASVYNLSNFIRSLIKLMESVQEIKN